MKIKKEKKYKKSSQTILDDASSIIFDREQKKAKEYGPFNESMSKAAKIASLLTGKNISTEDFYRCMIALKLSRLTNNTKYDTILDGIAYLAAYSEFLELKKQSNEQI